jgi:tetratricopeptide (TPR) repeat protein
MVPGLLGLAAVFLHAAEQELPLLRKQLKAAEAASDNPAVVELSRRIVDADPRDSKTWETLATKQLELDDQDRCAATLDAWQARVHPRPKAIDNIRGDLAMARKDYKSAEHYWRSYVAANPEATDPMEKLAKLSESTEHWQEAADWRTRAFAQSKTATRLIARANDYLELRAWDKAFADVDKANAIDPSDATVKDALPRFELLNKFVPQIKVLDAQIAKSPAAPVPWLDRARLFTLGNRPNLALKDSEHAMNLASGMMRARIQAAEALLDLGRGDEAANLEVNYNLKRDENNHVSDEALRTLGASDNLVLKNPGQAEPFVLRAKALLQINTTLRSPTPKLPSSSIRAQPRRIFRRPTRKSLWVTSAKRLLTLKKPLGLIPVIPSVGTIEDCLKRSAQILKLPSNVKTDHWQSANQAWPCLNEKIARGE